MDTKLVKKIIRDESKYYLYFILSLVLLFLSDILAIIPPKLFQSIVDVIYQQKILNLYILLQE